MAVYKRLSDGAVLDYSHVLGSFDRFIGIYDFKRTSEFSYGEIAQAREIATYLEQKTFSIDLLITDTDGSEQLAALDFFKDGGKYTVTGPEINLETLSFWVVSIDTKFFDGGADIITLTCQAEFGDFVEENIVMLNKQSIASGAYPGWSGSYTNNSGTKQTIRFKIEKPSADTNFNSPVSTRLLRAGQGISVTLGGFSSLGELEPRAEKRVVVDSYNEVIEGHAVISPMSANFFELRPGQTAIIALEGFPAPTAGSYTVEVYAYSVKRKVD